MKKITKTIIALSVLVGLASCAKEQAPVTPETENNGMISLTLTAGQANSETRAAISSTDSKVINWSKDDKISVFDGDKTNCEFILKDEDAGKATGTFTGEVTKTSESGYTALYPYQSGASYDGTKISGVVLKNEQTATAGSFDPSAALMCAKSSSADGALGFKNVVGYVKITTGFECKKITLVSNSPKDDIIAGTADITPGDSPAVSVTSGSTSQVSLIPAANTATIAAGTYYIAILPGKLNSGFKLVFTMTDGKEYYKGSSNLLEIKSNGVKKLGTISSINDLTEIIYKDLSESESANCYLIQAAGDYKFKAVQGNSTTTIDNVASVDVLWESFGTADKIKAGELISYFSYNDGYVRFFTPDNFAEGNAVIAAKDASGTILWSWHIWCAESCNEQDYKNSAGTMMDRNLGATSAAIPTSADDVSSVGLLYQWGRKDPFLGAATFGSNTKAVSTNNTAWGNSDATIDAKLATQNPMTFYKGMSNVMPNDSWASKKTINDPCPAGWRVPDGGDAGIWAKAIGTTNTTDAGAYGLNFSTVFGTNATIWYPASGRLSCYDGSLENVKASGHYWSVTPYEYYDYGEGEGEGEGNETLVVSDEDAFYLLFYISGGIYESYSDPRSYGMSVRCQKVSSN